MASRKRWRLDCSVKIMVRCNREWREQMLGGCSVFGMARNFCCSEGTRCFANKAGRVYWVQIVIELEYHAKDSKLFFSVNDKNRLN